MGFLSWIIIGLIVGALTKLTLPADDAGEVIVTMNIGITGALIGGFIAVQLGYGDTSGFDVRSLVIAVIGGLVLLGGYRFLSRACSERMPSHG